MKKILVLGAGLSASTMIRYLLQHAAAFNWQVRVVDQSLETVKRKIGTSEHGVALSFNALDRTERWEELKQADLVISMLPARFHIDIAKDCLELGKHLITPSYVSPEMRALNDEVVAKGLTFLNEVGVDPGIDHMSAMKIIHEIEEKGGTITSFKSYCGGLIAPESDNNPWHYKFTWNPRNVVLAGQGGMAQYIDRGQYKFIPYTELFQRIEIIEAGGMSFEGYANRDSLSYRPLYGLETIPTMFRGTLRGEGFCSKWNVFVQLGMTDDVAVLPQSEALTPRTFLNAFLPFDESKSVEEKFEDVLQKWHVKDVDSFAFLGLFEEDEPIGLAHATAAQILEKLLVEKWKLEPNDKDMLVMVHLFEYQLNGQKCQLQSSMINIGEDPMYTSMSNTVGLPVAIAAKLILTEQVQLLGVQLPTLKEWYAPILEELSQYGITFEESFH